MVHLATLVHDDVMDEADIRRGLPTLAANWGNEIAVLFGDCLFAQAVKLAAGFPRRKCAARWRRRRTRSAPARFCRRAAGGISRRRGAIISG